MLETIPLAPGATLRYYPDHRFKKAALSVQLLRPMCKEEASLNALLVSVLLRGTEHYPDLRSITWKLDELYGSAVSPMARRIGNVQAVGFYMNMIEDRFAMEGDQILAPAAAFLQELFLKPYLVSGCFSPEIVESEKKNLISAIDSQRNDKRTYASIQMLRHLCQGDSFGVPRIGDREDVSAITPEMLYRHYRKVLSSSAVEIFYVGSREKENVIRLLMPLAQGFERQNLVPIVQSGLKVVSEPREFSEIQEISQGKLSMGFVTPVTHASEDFYAMQVMNGVYGSGSSSKLFLNVREKRSLCYYVGSAYYGSKGILTVSSGIDPEHYETAKEEILHQLSLCARGEITGEELHNAKQALLSGLYSVPDSPGSLENFYATAAISGLKGSLETYAKAVERVTAEDVARCAASVKLHTVFFLKGVQ